jgi:hypothetical protein
LRVLQVLILCRGPFAKHHLSRIFPAKIGLPGARTHEVARKHFSRGDMQEVERLVHKAAAQAAAEQKAAAQAQGQAAEKQRATREDSTNKQDEEDFDDEEPSEPEPDCQFGVKIGGSPGKTAGLTQMRDMIRIHGEI